MTLTDKQKKLLWIAAAILVVIHFAPTVWSNIRQAWASRDQAAQPMKQSAAHYAAVTSAPQPTPNAQFAKLMGVWYGTAVRGSGDFCHLRLELTVSQDKPGTYTGYSTRSCGPVPFVSHAPLPTALTADIMRKMTPVSTILTGPVENNTIHLRIEQSIGTPGDGCQPTSYILTPFGANQLAVQWEDDHCAGGQVTMGRVPR